MEPQGIRNLHPLHETKGYEIKSAYHAYHDSRPLQKTSSPEKNNCS